LPWKVEAKRGRGKNNYLQVLAARTIVSIVLPTLSVFPKHTLGGKKLVLVLSKPDVKFVRLLIKIIRVSFKIHNQDVRSQTRCTV
jgi:hypothetical protein